MIKIFLLLLFMIVYSKTLTNGQSNGDIISWLKRLDKKVDQMDQSLKKVTNTVEKVQSQTKEMAKYVGIGREFMFVKTLLPWFYAEKECQKWGGHLVTVKSQKENDYFFKEGLRRGFAGGGYGAGSAWIGLNDQLSEGHYVWVGDVQSSYLNWGGSEPTDRSHRENCGFIYGHFGGKMGDHSCSNSLSFICERINYP